MPAGALPTADAPPRSRKTTGLGTPPGLPSPFPALLTLGTPSLQVRHPLDFDGALPKPGGPLLSQGSRVALCPSSAQGARSSAG